MHPARVLPWLLVLLTAAPTLARPDSTEEALPVRCPALDAFHGPTVCGLPFRTGSLSHVVLGTGTPKGEDAVSIRVEKCYGGSPLAGSITVTTPWPKSLLGPRILYLSMRPDGSGWSLYDDHYPAHMKPEAANLIGTEELEHARWLRRVLRAEAILVGREVSFASKDRSGPFVDAFDRDLLVKEVLAGPDELAGRTVRIEVPEFDFSEELTPEDRIYVVGRDGSLLGGSDEGHPPPLLVERASLEIAHALPLTVRPAVAAALERGDELPVVVIDGKDGPVRTREIVFQGSIESALLVQDSDGDRAAAHAARSLVLRQGRARTPLRRAIRDRLLDATVGGYYTHRTLKRLIRILSDMEKAEPRGHLEELIELWLEHIANSERGPGVRPEQHYRALERTSENRSLGWLLRALGAAKARERYGPGLRALQADAHPSWRGELRLVLDDLRLRQSTEFPAALERGTAANRRRSGEGLVEFLSHTCDVVAFSHDGRYLAYDPGHWIHLVRIEDWSLAAKLRCEASVSNLVFSPDDRWLYVSGGGGRKGLLARHAVPTLELDRTYGGYDQAIGTTKLSPDGRVLATFSYYDDRLRLVDAETGARLHEVATKGYGIGDAPLRCGVIHWNREGKLVLQPFHGGPAEPFTLPGLEAHRPHGWLVASKAGDTLVLPVHRGGDDALSRLVCWRVAGESAELSAARDVPEWGTSYLAVSPDGRLCAAVGKQNQLRVFSLPDLQVMGSLRLAKAEASDISVGSIAISPDGRWLAASEGRAHPALVDLRTLERLNPFAGHRASIRRLFFAPDGREVVTRDKDGVVMRWDAETLSGWESPGSVPPEPRRERNVCVSEDGRLHFEAAPQRKLSRSAEVTRTDLRTDERVTMTVPDRNYLSARRFGLVPDRRHVFFAEPGVLVLSRDDLRVVSELVMPDTDVLELDFSDDGRRYALLTPVKDHPTETRDRLPEDAKFLVSVHDTLTGETIVAFTLEYYATALALDAEGNRLALGLSDGTVERIDW